MTTPLVGLLAGIIILFPGPADPQQAPTQQPPEPSPNVIVLPEVAPGLTDKSPDSTPAATGVRLDLSEWKLTLPVGVKGKPIEVAHPRPDASADEHWFGQTPDHAVAFRAPVDGVTTSGSGYPRSELREMSADGASPASWSSTSGQHTMRVFEAFTHLPAGKAELVGAQIHDATHDISVFRLEGTRLWITDDNNPHYALATYNYHLGTPFQADYVVADGQIRAFYNGAPAATIPAPSLTGAYFKAGAYTQANCTNSSPCSDDNYGETVIYQLAVTHTRDRQTGTAPLRTETR